jgi:hypothetical protein
MHFTIFKLHLCPFSPLAKLLPEHFFLLLNSSDSLFEPIFTFLQAFGLFHKFSFFILRILEFHLKVGNSIVISKYFCIFILVNFLFNLNAFLFFVLLQIAYFA